MLILSLTVSLLKSKTNKICVEIKTQSEKSNTALHPRELKIFFPLVLLESATCLPILPSGLLTISNSPLVVLAVGWYSGAEVSIEAGTRVAAVLIIKALDNEYQYVDFLEKNAYLEDYILAK